MTFYGQATKSRRRMPRHWKAMKDAESCDKSRGAANKLWSGNFRMGKPSRSYVLLLYSEYIAIWGERGELKHLSTRRKRNQIWDSVSSGERKRRSPNQSACILGLWGPDMGLRKDSRMAWKGQPQTVTVRYAKSWITLGCPRVPRDTWNLVGI